MKLRTFPMAVILFLALVLALPQGASAEAVGHLTEVKGRVDLLKGGKLPANPVKEGDEVAVGDVLRAKSLSKAQITFVDQTTLTMSPESRIAIEEYMFDPAKGKRNAVLQMFQGLALFVVSKIHQTEQPDFVVKTHTAIMGIRGTEVGIRLQPNESTFMTFSGLIRVRSNFAEISGYVDGKAGQGITARGGLPPTLPFEITAEDRQLFMRQLATGLTARVRGREGTDPKSSDVGMLAGLGGRSGGPEGVIIPPRVSPIQQVAPAPPTTELQTYTVNFSTSGSYIMTKGQEAGPHNADFIGSITLKSNQVVWYKVEANDPASPGNFSYSSEGTIDWLLKGTLSRDVGSSGPFTGQVTATGTTSGGTQFGFEFNASYDGTRLTLNPVSGTYTPLPNLGSDFTNPGGSDKPNPGSATISWPVAAYSPPAGTPPPEQSPPSPLSVNGSYPGSYSMQFKKGHKDATYAGSVQMGDSATTFVIEAQDPRSPGNFSKSTSGSMTWNLEGSLDPTATGTYSGTLTATGITAGGTAFSFPLSATSDGTNLKLDTLSPTTGSYSAGLGKGKDFTSPGESHKITQGSGTLSIFSSSLPLTTSTISTITQTSPVVTSPSNPTLPLPPSASQTTVQAVTQHVPPGQLNPHVQENHGHNK